MSPPPGRLYWRNLLALRERLTNPGLGRAARDIMQSAYRLGCASLVVGYVDESAVLSPGTQHEETQARDDSRPTEAAQR